jgi:primase-polymerase (primpol)-like protein
MFSADDPFTGIDLDHCRDVETGQLNGWAVSHIVQVDSYTEVSASGTGVHSIVRGKKPGERCKKGDVEMYDRDHFFTTTGQHLVDTPATIEDRAAEVSAFYAFVFGEDAPEPQQQGAVGLPKVWSDEQLLTRATRGKNGARFQRLWAGDAFDHLGSDGKPDESAADLALCRYLAFWTGRNRERMDRLFRQSGLMRPKWERT